MYELWFRLAYRSFLEGKQITSCIRPGDRRYPSPKGCSIGDLARVRIIEKPGDESTGKMPVFADHPELLVEITGLHVCTIATVPAHLAIQCASDCWASALIRIQLALIYDRVFVEDDEITVVSFKYV